MTETPFAFVEALSQVRLPNVFNPYRDVCPQYDVPQAASIRSLALEKILQVATKRQVDSIWIGRDLGYKGGRRTGLALTDEAHLNMHASRWGVELTKATSGAVVSERTATVIWGLLNKVPDDIFLWNVFPFHPYSEGDQFSNRAHTAFERRSGEGFLSDLVHMLRPKRLVAIGNDAEVVAKRIASKPQCDVVKLRHPSYGGHTDFIMQCYALYGLSSATTQGSLFN